MDLVSTFFWDVSDPVCPIGPCTCSLSLTVSIQITIFPQLAAEFILYQEILLSFLGLKPALGEERTQANLLVLIFCKNPQGWQDLRATCTHGIGSCPKRQQSHLHAINSAWSSKVPFLQWEVPEITEDGWKDGRMVGWILSLQGSEVSPINAIAAFQDDQ